MTFPLQLKWLGLRLDPHLLFEILALGIAIPLYFHLRRRAGRPPFPPDTILWLICGCIFGAVLGSKILVLLSTPLRSASAETFLRMAAEGKSAVGALLGGWAGIEIAKRALHLRSRTGEFFVWPLAIATAVGRIGCFFAGLPDQTHGVATTLPWGVDFGDGIPRHPIQLYESAFVIVLAGVLHAAPGAAATQPARLFRRYIAGYLAFRLAVDFIRPREVLLLNLGVVQIVCVLALAWLALQSTPAPGHPTPDGTA